MPKKDNTAQYRANKKWRESNPEVFKEYKFEYNKAYYEQNHDILQRKRHFNRERKKFLAILL